MITAQQANTIAESIVEELSERGWPEGLPWPEMAEVVSLMLKPVVARPCYEVRQGREGLELVARGYQFDTLALFKEYWGYSDDASYGAWQSMGDTQAIYCQADVVERFQSTLGHNIDVRWYVTPCVLLRLSDGRVVITDEECERVTT